MNLTANLLTAKKFLWLARSSRKRPARSRKKPQVVANMKRSSCACIIFWLYCISIDVQLTLSNDKSICFIESYTRNHNNNGGDPGENQYWNEMSIMYPCRHNDQTEFLIHVFGKKTKWKMNKKAQGSQ